MGRSLFTPEQVLFITQHVLGRNNQELTELINYRFNLGLSCTQIRAFKKNHKLSSGLDGRFSKGHTPFNKGRKGVSTGGKETQFKLGRLPHNYKPVGTERVNADDYVDIKIQDGKAQKNWRGKHLLVWEEHHGRPVPPGHAVIFGDRNRRNFNPDNLILVSRKQLAIMNKKHLIQSNAELTRTGIIIADVLKKIGDRKGKRRKATGRSKRGGD